MDALPRILVDALRPEATATSARSQTSHATAQLAFLLEADNAIGKRAGLPFSSAATVPDDTGSRHDATRRASSGVTSPAATEWLTAQDRGDGRPDLTHLWVKDNLDRDLRWV